MTNPVLELDGLSITTAAGLRLVEDLSFDVSPGEAVGLVGESGSGKTLTGLSCLDLLPTGVSLSAGEVRIDGEVVASAAKHRRQRRKASMVFQSPMTSLNPVMKIGTQVAEAVRLNNGGNRRAAKRRALELLELVGLPDPEQRAQYYPYQLSGGQCQRVVIAVALACEAKVMVADEPTTALDVTTQVSVMNLIDKLRRELGIAVIMISHDLALVSQYCSRLEVMYAGQVVESGSLEDVLAAPAHPYLDGLLGCLPERALAGGDMVALPGRVPPPDEFPSGCRFAGRCALAVDSCSEPQQLLPVEAVLGSGRLVRCHRHELVLHSASGAYGKAIS
ncbi:ABC transporter ATP-binding protein [Rhodococcus sp. IEGM 1381]|uniref:ABC transporter ATP-binding protein n=1 Tax=Rhodococcus sp. IEGM 1381 TaxID=3047085 RepID=UPI0024B6C9DF|nr:ABC transporter ATP-binding protein [Rhodococcus sp. IEGM 1381]MDI9894435.1 ABC transporter ATP-binding protein [Rhodococcus sp. IEGM 1381]